MTIDRFPLYERAPIDEVITCFWCDDEGAIADGPCESSPTGWHERWLNLISDDRGPAEGAFWLTKKYAESLPTTIITRVQVRPPIQPKKPPMWAVWRYGKYMRALASYRLAYDAWTEAGGMYG